MKKQNKNKDRIKLSKKNKRILFILLAILVFGFALRFGIDYLGKKQEVVDDSVPVSYMTLKESDFEKYIEIFGNAKAEKESIIIPKIPAIVEKVNVQPGQAVKKGDILFVMNTEDMDSQLKQSEAAYDIARSNAENTQGAGNEQQLQQLKAALDSSRVNYDDAIVNYGRIKSLYDSGGASKSEFEQLENTLAISKTQYETSKKNYELYINEIQAINSSIANSQLKQAEAGYDGVKKQYDDMIVRADIDGEVGISNIGIGKTAGLGQSAAMTVVDYRKIILDLNVTEENIIKITNSSKCTASFDVLPGHEFEGKVEGISPSVDPQTGLYQVKIAIDNSDKAIKPGMYASVKIFEAGVKNVITLPIDTVIKDNDKNYVFTLNDDNTASKKEVKLSRDNGKVVIISSGLSYGEKVIFKGQDYLNDKDQVRVITE
ncbi:MAG: efflux RND transporter periplasmic adaptor subunit [Proteocatella sp.]